MKVWVILQNTYLAYEFDNNEVYKVVDSLEKAEQFIEENPPEKSQYSGTVSYHYIEKEVQ